MVYDQLNRGLYLNPSGLILADYRISDGINIYKFRPFQFQLPFIAIHTNLYAHAVIFTKFEFDLHCADEFMWYFQFCLYFIKIGRTEIFPLKGTNTVCR